MQFLMDDRIVRKHIDVLHDVLVKVESFIFLADFFILDYDFDFEVAVILGTPFLATSHVLVEIEKGMIKVRLNDEQATSKIL